MGKITHDLLPKQRSRKYNLKVDIDLYPYAQELYDELNKIGIVNRVKSIPQLGVIKVPKKLAKTRYDYIMLQLYLHQLIKVHLQCRLQLTYNNYISAKEFGENYQYNSKNNKPTIGDILQILTIVYNIGHFNNTFTASRAAMMLAVENETFKNILLMASSDPRYKNAVEKMLEEMNYQRFHLLNSLLILEKCDTSKQAVSLAIEILYTYINQTNLSENDKLTYAFGVFKSVRTVSYMAYDLQIANTPITIDLFREDAMLMLLQELLSEYNNTQSSNQLVAAISKMLDDTVYNENSNAICYYNLSKRMEKQLLKGKTFEGENYYFDYFIIGDAIFNKAQSHKRDFVQEHILKLTFCNCDRLLSRKLLSELEKINNTRVGYYDRHTGERTILVSIKRCCNYESKVNTSFRVLKCAISYLRRINQIEPNDVRYLLCTKFFLYYFMDQNPIVIKPTIDKEVCLVCTRGKNARVKEISSLLNRVSANEDQRHETQFMLQLLKKDYVNDTSICIPASILVYQKNAVGKKMCEFDGMVIHTMRKQGQIIFLEAKNTSHNPAYGKKCLKGKLDKLLIKYESSDIQIIGCDAIFRYTFNVIQLMTIERK